MTTPPVPASAELRLDPGTETGRVAPEVFGHFLESAFFGNIEGGVFDEDHPQALPGPGARAGLRADVLDLCRPLRPSVVRWPGGNFTSPYRWEDGIGPRDDRPRRLELAWGSEESNRFGTDEFLTWCEELGAEAYLAHSARDVDEAVRWIEYANYAGDTHYARLRAAHGHPEPYRVTFWGLGNEVYGRWQLGHRDAARYAADAREHARFLRLVDPGIKTVGVGWAGAEDWTEQLIGRAGPDLDYVSIHLYGASTHLSGDLDRADEYDQVVGQATYFERQLSDYSTLVAGLAARAGVDRPLGLALDEWNVRHLEPASWPEPLAGADGGVADRPTPDAGPRPDLRVNRYSPRTLADALCSAGVFHAIHRLAGARVPVTMSNPVNLVNANGIVVARPGGAVGSALHPVWDLYRNHLGPVSVASRLDGPGRSAAVRQGHTIDADGDFETHPDVVADLDAAATVDEDRAVLRVAVINRHRSRPARTRLVLSSSRTLPPTVRVHRLGPADDDRDPMAVNLLSRPDRVALRDLGEVDLEDGHLTFAPHSVTVVALPLRR